MHIAKRDIRHHYPSMYISKREKLEIIKKKYCIILQYVSGSTTFHFDVDLFRLNVIIIGQCRHSNKPIIILQINTVLVCTLLNCMKTLCIFYPKI